MSYTWIYITNPNKEEALKIARTLVEAKLVACANIYEGVTSVYAWEGKTHEESETILIAKTRSELFEKVRTKVEEIHPYDCPCVISIPIEQGNAAYLDWLRDSTQP